jgi:hypothetical protein
LGVHQQQEEKGKMRGGNKRKRAKKHKVKMKKEGKKTKRWLVTKEKKFK